MRVKVTRGWLSNWEMKVGVALKGEVSEYLDAPELVG